MTNKRLFILLGLTAALALTGCGSDKPKETEAARPAETESAAIAESDAEDSANIAEDLEPITPSDYLVKDASEYVTLCDLDGLTADQVVYEVTDQMVMDRIEEELYMFSDEVEKEKAGEGDIVYADVTSSIQGSSEAPTEDSTFFTIGDQDYGEEFDQKLVGASADDELSFSITFGDDTWVEEWTGQTVDFTVKVTGVYEQSIPEYDEAFLSEYTDYSTKEEYEAFVRESLEEEYQEQSYTDTVESLLQSALDQSEFNGCPEDLRASCEEEVRGYYSQFAEGDDIDTALDMFGITQEDLDAEVLDTVNTRLFISAVCQKLGLELTEDEYVAQVTSLAGAYGFYSDADYEAESGRDALVWSMYEDKVRGALYDAADITEVPYSEAETEEALTPAELAETDGIEEGQEPET